VTFHAVAEKTANNFRGLFIAAPGTSFDVERPYSAL